MSKSPYSLAAIICVSVYVTTNISLSFDQGWNTDILKYKRRSPDSSKHLLKESAENSAIFELKKTAKFIKHTLQQNSDYFCSILPLLVSAFSHHLTPTIFQILGLHSSWNLALFLLCLSTCNVEETMKVKDSLQICILGDR